MYSNMIVCGIYSYDSNKNFIKRESNYTTTHSISSNARYIKIEVAKTGGLTYNDFASNLVISTNPDVLDISYAKNQITSSTVNKLIGNMTVFAKW